MKLIYALLEADYKGRGESHLPPHPRLLIIKDDGSVCVHSEKGYKPMNYMVPPTSLEDEEVAEGRRLTVRGKKEELVITLTQVFFERELQAEGEEPGHSKSTSEKDLQLWLSEHMELFGEGYRFVEREHQTGAGPVDLLAERGGALVAIEVKRNTSINTVGQVLRYRDALQESNPTRPVECIIAAFSFNKSTLSLAEKKGVRCVEVPSEWGRLADGVDHLAKPV